MEEVVTEKGTSLEHRCDLTMKKTAQLSLGRAWDGFRSVSGKNVFPACCI